MVWARHAAPAEDHGRMVEVRQADRVRRDREQGRAALTVADHASDAADCAELLAMLGLDPSAGR